MSVDEVLSCNHIQGVCGCFYDPGGRCIVNSKMTFFEDLKILSICLQLSETGSLTIFYRTVFRLLRNDMNFSFSSCLVPSHVHVCDLVTEYFLDS